MFKKILLILSMVLIVLTASCKKKEEKPQDEAVAPENQQQEVLDEGEDVYKNKVAFTIEMQDGGVMKGELYPDVAPETVKNFMALCKDKFYDGLIFHRVIEDFMIQGGGFDDEMEMKESKSIKGEFLTNGFSNPLKHERGVISMARTDEPDSASCQFFIMHKDAPHLDGEYAAFGKITEGLDIIDEIASVETGIYEGIMKDVPKEAQVIKTITIGK